MLTAPLAPRWARALVLGVAALALALFAGGLVVRMQALQQVCLEPSDFCNLYKLVPPAGAEALAAAGLTLPQFAVLQLVKWLFFSSIWMGLGALILARKSHEWVALVTAFWLLTFPTQWDMVVRGLAAAVPVLAPLSTLTLTLVNVGLIIFLVMFPTGRMQPRWVRWVLVAGLAQTLLSAAPPAWHPSGINWDLLTLVLGMFMVVGLVIAQIVRYRRYSTSEERDRTRWVIFGLSLAPTSLVVIIALTAVVGPASGLLADYTGDILFQLCMSLIPLSVGLAILRSRLFDINVIIRRTLIYSVLTAVLALVYFGSVIVLQNIFGLLTGERQNALVTVLSTLLIAALFGTVRARVQQVIDRRFFRRKYDATRALANFSASVRDEVELAQLSGRLLTVVDETMQPAHLGLWVRASANPSPRRNA